MDIIFFLLEEIMNVYFMVRSRAIHGSGRVGFGPNPNSTRRCRVEGRGTWTQPSEKIGLVGFE